MKISCTNNNLEKPRENRQKLLIFWLLGKNCYNSETSGINSIKLPILSHYQFQLQEIEKLGRICQFHINIKDMLWKIRIFVFPIHWYAKEPNFDTSTRYYLSIRHPASSFVLKKLTFNSKVNFCSQGPQLSTFLIWNPYSAHQLPSTDIQNLDHQRIKQATNIP